MEGQDDAIPRPAAARGKGKAPGPPPPPPRRDEANGGHRHRRRRRRRARVRGEELAFSIMMVAATYFLGEALTGALPQAAWSFAAFIVWIIGARLLFLFMN
ncbi:hypothetical protein BAE44_0018532 [Dichanthelium oligosanthes]|uniref:Uncharacterized protein n=1 Tax=Dichanthelium oligosanthes TaxID=888268 RepID=A0A1E5V5R8_9POAL|nr:hypothetical protein BAE44_0018532 [Dichanthelium oligosanthes]